MKLMNFLRNEDGQLTVDWTVLVAALMGVGLVVTSEVANGLENVTDGYDGINTGKGMMTMFVSQPEAVGDDYVDSDPCAGANPGNELCVGNATETPNGDEDAWGDGSTGVSDVVTEETNDDSRRRRSRY